LFSTNHVRNERKIVANTLKAILAAALTFLVIDQVHAVCTPGGPATNCPAPSGTVILNLDGTTIPHSYTPYSATFTATQGSTNISFALREDPAFLFLSNVSVVDTTTSSGNLLTNGNFNAGPVGANQPTGWTYLNEFGATFAGIVQAGTGVGGNNSYYDGAVQAYDGITQNILTTIGDIYTVSFQLNDNSSNTVFSALSTNGDTTDTGGNGINLVVYAGAVPVNAVPEPETYAMLLSGLGLLGFFARRRNQQAV
jgi:hypothetical protein